MEFSHILALGAAFSWTISGLFGHAPARQLGSLHFNRIRMIMASLWLVPMVMISGSDFSLASHHILPVIASSFVGVVLGDYFLFLSMRRLGPRMTGILFAANAPIAAILSWALLSEVMHITTILAIIVGFIGIALAVLYGKRRATSHIWEQITPPLWIGVMAGLVAALGQAGGVLILRPVMAEGANPWVASLVRVLFAAICLWAIYPFQSAAKKPQSFATILSDKSLVMGIIGNGFFGLSFGVALMLWALETGPVADVSLLASISPVLVLPFIWWQTKLVPPIGAWAGALLVVVSSYLLLF